MSKSHHSFPCSQCGECCKRVHLLPKTADMDRGDGTCMHFDELLNQCRVYAERPDICRIDRQYEMNYRLIMTWDEFVKVNQTACETLQLS